MSGFYGEHKPSKVRQIISYFSRRQIPLYAASAGFFMVLALFPLLILLLSLVRYAGFSVETVTEAMEGLVPQALMPTATGLIYNVYRNTSGTVLSLSALTALWSASSGLYGVIRGMNNIYDVTESRGYVYTRAMSLVYTFIFLLVLLLTLVLHVFGKSAQRWLLTLNAPVFEILAYILNMRLFLLLVVQTLVFTLMYMFLPNRSNGFWESIPGALFTAIGWQLLSQLFSVYVEQFSRYTDVYGSVYLLALGMLWLYLCMCILFCGGTLNRWLKEK
ncbi:MAG: YihY/virulence factor BrkB family protein [Oscillospiraceae bacterium]|nr:YihY/virulence factor BrkB family protein [Oscillospiraceae bacterium]